MTGYPSHNAARVRRGIAATEMAVLLPFLGLMFVAGTDYARIIYDTVTVENAARNGAYFASDYGIYDYSGPSDAATEDTTNLSPTPTVSVAYGTSPTGPFNLTSSPSSYIESGTAVYVQVTVNWTFNTITTYPYVPSSVSIQRTSVMQMAPLTPKFSSSGGTGSGI